MSACPCARRQMRRTAERRARTPPAPPALGHKPEAAAVVAGLGLIARVLSRSDFSISVPCLSQSHWNAPPNRESLAKGIQVTPPTTL